MIHPSHILVWLALSMGLWAISYFLLLRVW